MSGKINTVGFNFLEQPELPAPRVTEQQAEKLLAAHYGLSARAESLGSNQDKNFLVFGAGEQPAGVLKIANPAFTALELAAQDAAAALIADAEPALRVAVPLPNLDGEVSTSVDDLLGGTAHVRLLRYLPGGTLVGLRYLAPSVVAKMGEVAARVSRALADFHHPGLDRALQWDLRHAHDVVASLASHVEDPVLRARIIAAATEAWDRLVPLADELPCQAVHLDLTDANVVAAAPGGGALRQPDGIIDFGDLSDTWAVSEAAITLSSVLGHPGSSPTSILPGVKAFHAIRPLRAAEADALWPLLVLRTAVLLVSAAQQALLDPDNDYLTNQSDDELRMFERATSVPVDLMTAVIRAELGLSATPAPVQGAALIDGLDAETVRTLDLSTVSEVFDTAAEGPWDQAFQDGLAHQAIDDGATLVVTRFGEANLTRAPRLSQDSPDVVATGISLWPADTVTLRAPWAGEIDSHDGGFTLRGPEYELTVSGTAAATGALEAGAPVATLTGGGWTTIGVRRGRPSHPPSPAPSSRPAGRR
jgi:Ser/Thr protein kinase RdoA (MazF antagonist)